MDVEMDKSGAGHWQAWGSGMVMEATVRFRGQGPTKPRLASRW